MTYTTQRDLRNMFWSEVQAGYYGPTVKRERFYGDYNTDTRTAWCDWIDSLARNGQISEALAQRATL